MAPDPAPPPIILAIPAPSPPPNPSSLSLNSDPLPSTSDLSSSPSDPACPSPVPAHPPPVLPFSAPASSAPASQEQSRRDLPADLLCFQSLLPPSSSVEPPPVHQSPAPEPPLAASEPPLFSSLHHPPSDSHIAAQPAVYHLRSQPVRRNASVSSVSESPPAVLPESTAAVVPTAAPAPPSSSSPPLLNNLSKRQPLADDPLSAHPADLQSRSQPVRRNAQANPTLSKSYAQVTKGSPGPGFVRAHARDVDHFARLPRTGLNVICGSHEGMPACSIMSSDLPKVEGLYAKALVMKFHGGRPSLAASHKEFSSWGFESSFSIGPLSSKSLLLRFQEERDLLKVLTRPSSTLLTFPYKVFRWHNRCHLKEESCLVPIWISLPRLPLQCFAPEYLESFASLIGRFLCLDKATATLARPSEARMCIEIDLRKERPQFIWIGLFEGFKQPIVYERVPKFCSGCQVQGHTNVDCSKASLDTLQSLDSGPNSAFQECSQSARRNAKENSAPVFHENPHQSRTSSPTAASALFSASDVPQQDPHRSLSAAASSEQQLCDLLPHLPVPCPAAAVPLIDQVQCLAAAVPHPPSDLQSPSLQQSGVALSSSNTKTAPSASRLPAAAVPPSSSDPTACSFPLSPPGVQQVVIQTGQAFAAAPTPVLSAQAAPFSPSDPDESVQQTLSQINQHSTSPLRVCYNSHGARYITSLPPQINQLPTSSSQDRSNFHIANINLPPESHPNYALWEMIHRKIGEQGGLIHDPTPSNFPHQHHFFEGDVSEGSFETDSQQNSPLASPHENVNLSLCASEGEQLDEEPPGFQGHISDVEFYQRPMSSKKNKRQPDGPLRVQLRTRKGPSKHK